MKRFLALGLLVTSLSAWAQVLAFRRPDNTTTDTYTFGASACNDSVTVQWINSTTINFNGQCTPGATLAVWTTDADCTDTPSGNYKSYDSISGILLMSGSRTGSVTPAIKLSELPGFTTAPADGGTVTPCGSTGVSKTHKLCGSIQYSVVSGFGCGTASYYHAIPLNFVYDTLPPTAPSITGTPAALDEGVKLTYTVDSDAVAVQMEARIAATADGGVAEDFRTITAQVSSTSGVITGKTLIDGTTYDVRLRAFDAAGNQSDPSDAVQVTPIKTLGFWAAYKQAGGTDEGGCSSTGLALFPALAMLWASRRSRSSRSTR